MRVKSKKKFIPERWKKEKQYVEKGGKMILISSQNRQ